MAKIEVSKDLIYSVVRQDNVKYIKNTNKLVNNIVGSAIKQLSEKISYVSTGNVVLQPVNELFNGALVDNSYFTYFLGINNAQLELNTGKKTNFWKNFKNRWIWAWQNRKSFTNRRNKRRRKKKNKKEEKETLEFKFDPTKYTIYNLAEDLQQALTQFLSETSLISLKDNVLQIIGKDDFGANTKIVIILVNCNEHYYRYYAGRKRGFIDVDINSRLEALQNKISAVGDNFVKMLKILNTLYYNVNGFMSNQVLLESVLCACPEDLFFGDDIYKVFLKIVNYIAIKSIKDVKSINDSSKTVGKDPVCGNSLLGFSKMLDSVYQH